MKVRMRLTRAPLIAARLALRRMRFLACGVFAIDGPYKLMCLNEKAALMPEGRAGVALP
jgi:hypothetical protein